MSNWTFGEVISGPTADGRVLHSAVFNENEVRAAAGMTMVLGAVAFAPAYFDADYLPLKVVTSLFCIEFLIRVTTGLKYSPMGLIARALTQRRPPEWVSAKPKRFAWTIGLVLLWLESVLGVCIGCEIHGRLVRRGWTKKDPAFEVCAHGACELPVREPAPAATLASR